MTRRKLPIGMQTLRDIRESNCYYVDKTAYVGRLLDEGKHYFLSRPRRFGKSLFLDTCKELFEGNEPLFEGLAIHDRWDWSVRHPVLRLSFGSGNFKEPGQLVLNLKEQLVAAERRAEVVTDYDTAPGRLSALLEALHQQVDLSVRRTFALANGMRWELQADLYNLIDAQPILNGKNAFGTNGASLGRASSTIQGRFLQLASHIHW